MKISIVIPAKNEQESLPRLLKDLKAAVSGETSHLYEIIVVNDHSSDETASTARAFGAVVVDNHRAGGKGHALMTGFEKAGGDYVIMMDADGSHLPEFIPAFVQHLDTGFGLVIGSRQLGGSDEYTFLRALGNIFLSGVFNLITGTRITDVLNGYKGFRRDVFTRFKYKSKEFEIEIEIVVNALRLGYKVGEFPCHERARDGGVPKSKIIRHGMRFFLRILELAIPFRLAQIFKGK